VTNEFVKLPAVAVKEDVSAPKRPSAPVASKPPCTATVRRLRPKTLSLVLVVHAVRSNALSLAESVDY